MVHGVGMRRILKTPRDPVEWVRQRYDKNLYDVARSATLVNDQAAALRAGLVGTNVPALHEIYSANPPIYDPPRVPREILKARRAATRPLTELARRHLRRESRAVPRGRGADGGALDPNRSAAHARAYERAVRELRYRRDRPDVDEMAAARAVDEVLAREDRGRRRRVRAAADRVVGEAAADRRRRETREALREDDDEPPSPPPPATPSVLHGDPVAAARLAEWGARLRAVPYARWTVGAAASLDHWIATRVLGMSRATWDRLLEGRDDASSALARDVVAARRALFPETTVHETDTADEDESLPPDERRVDELLAALDLGTDDEDEKQEDEGDEKEKNDRAYRETLSSMLEDLQSWRERHAEEPFDAWDDPSKEEFDTFVKNYAAHLNSRGKEDDVAAEVDVEATREALLSRPAMRREASDSFFDALRDRTEAELFLDRLEKSRDSSSSADDDGLAAFLTLPYEERLERLLALGAMRPLHDEYHAVADDGKSTEAFFERYGDVLSPTTFDEKREAEVLRLFGDFRAERARREMRAYRRGELGLEYETPPEEEEQEKETRS